MVSSEATAPRSMNELKVWLVAHQVPYPPNHGGRLDMWNRIVALSRRGVRLRLVTWADEEVTEEQLEHMREHVEDVAVYRRNRAPFLALHPRYPTTVISRALPRSAYNAELKEARVASADVVFLEGLFGAIFAISLARDLGVPLVYRSQNVEHKYVEALLAAETDPISKARLFSNVLRTRNLERRVRRESSLVYDISQEDRDAWREDGSADKAKVLGYYLRPDENLPLVGVGPRPDIDVLYVGNLHSVNNVFGLEWFAAKVVPLLKGLRILVAGTKPSLRLRGVLEGAGAEVVADPEEVRTFYERARVLINPVWHGSGVNVKMIEMLATGKPVVSTSPGTRGLAPRLLAHVSVADRPTDFANSVRSRLDDAPSPAQREAVVEEHGWENVVHLIEDLRRLCSRG